MQRSLLIILLLLAVCLLCAYNSEKNQTGGSVDAPHGLNVESYHTDAQGQQLGLIRQSVLNQDINFDWQNGPVFDTGLSDDVMLIINGYLKPAVSGQYRFFIDSDDGVVLYIDGVKVIDEWKIQAVAQSSTGLIELDATRYHSFDLRWYEHSGAATLKLYWEGTSATGESIVGRSIVPIDVFYQTLPVEPEAEPRAEAEAAPAAPSAPEPPAPETQTTINMVTEQLVTEENRTEHVHQVINDKIAANVQALKEIRDRLELLGSIDTSDESIVRKVNDRVQRAETELNNRLTEIRRQQEVLEIRLTRLLEIQRSQGDGAGAGAGAGAGFNEATLAGHEQRLNGIETKLFDIKGGLTEVKMILRDITSKLDNGYRCQVSNNLCR